MTLQNCPPYWQTTDDGLRTAIDTLNVSINGGGNNSGNVTLTAATTTTTVTDTRVSVTSAIGLMPTTANAATALATTYITTDKGSFLITHANNAQTDRTYRYSVGGS